MQRQAGLMCQSEAWKKTSVYFRTVYEESKYERIAAYGEQFKQSYLPYLFCLYSKYVFLLFGTKMKMLLD